MIKNAQIHFNEMGTPVADDFDDVYFSNDDGLAESHYVFFTQNKIEQRLVNHDQDHFVIAETGFGTGLNFLNTWQQYSNLKTSHTLPRLHFISFEKFPISHSDLRTALAAWPTLAQYAKQLCKQYPIALAGCHRLEFDDGNITLDLWFGDVHDSIPKMSCQSNGIVDAWFLDGFAPSKNPDMWQQSLFDAMANLSRKDATFATFTAAGFVRRGLQQAGFVCQKVKGYGRKREMVTGHLPQTNGYASTPAYYQTTPSTLTNVAIIGGGVASACLAFQLSKRRIKSTLFCQDDALAKGASHNRQGAIYPHLQADCTPQSEFYAHSFLYAKRFYEHIRELGFEFTHQWCGVLLQAVNKSKGAQQQTLVDKGQWPDALIRPLDSSQATEVAGTSLPYGGLFIEQAGWVNPAQLTQAVFNAAQASGCSKAHFNTDIEHLEQSPEGWLLHSQNQVFGPFSEVFVCAGEHSDRFEQTQSIGLQGVRGQVSHVQAGNVSSELKTVLCHKGYFTPALDGLHCMGATFDKDSKSRAVTEQDNITNRAQLDKFYAHTEFAQSLGDITGAKAAVRCCFADHLPMLGQVPEQHDLTSAYKNLRKGKYYGFGESQQPFEGLHIVTGFGARGLCSAPLATEHLVASLCNEPRPFSERIHQAIHPNRFIVRDLIRSNI
ncbi:bifunctional tRNA (5-methylaminomethyl-2-thiouridine)(34)-methyltransferase MnmD/FAD-dependent 5-carboxymethylaminomethyl-2-thiouridine(34) oxidoreductase MnmC [Pseudoalteromonas sp. S16_S37]|uniref:bifunctional tRNA (5-methylaminomethyl-2-thiouridine)(34)-methyltransferase MnmD/FAD-dependent 5-carboxymethylaminomethyl-2-thiouridine(34) oxidoreductase MnmC n=1 Tax=Pseudoalteromonas sp. S16_S37 TaxID=2720228 RepID=UPI0016801398|nr:bifunctional tRNA (5-methylaminomethyl-2-thiouridine)(34)-methyltransferase MnmD/FAD-dependent 5-carboxymethylaminomethyl-2-thiouridine(34) oxidoreductase MnmC [Pseudoalteromonas sp. S16_S37]MBD1583627.1 bifunctional tRNA (5-methylaminomethyl-2-thiouridine)(34)-methyltransferase MnmD/FAD-dependent 5-carboxymethylaminomethyl-2-thiouridine(34) oxidoreductase MnmC [Pseudoalteromonas sp. S16_S37]